MSEEELKNSAYQGVISELSGSLFPFHLLYRLDKKKKSQNTKLTPQQRRFTAYTGLGYILSTEDTGQVTEGIKGTQPVFRNS